MSAKNLYVGISRAVDEAHLFVPDTEYFRQGLHKSGDRLAALDVLAAKGDTKTLQLDGVREESFMIRKRSPWRES
jgi:hypothetical protein